MVRNPESDGLVGKERAQVSLVVDQVVSFVGKGPSRRLLSKGGGNKAGQGNQR